MWDYYLSLISIKVGQDQNFESDNDPHSRKGRLLSMVIDSVHRTLDNEETDRGVSQSGSLDDVRSPRFSDSRFSSKTKSSIQTWNFLSGSKVCEQTLPKHKKQSPVDFSKLIMHTVAGVPRQLLRQWAHLWRRAKWIVWDDSQHWRIPTYGWFVYSWLFHS